MILTREELDLLKPTISSYEWSRAVDTCGDLIDTIEQALQERDNAIMEGLRLTRLLEDAVRDRDWLKTEGEMLKELIQERPTHDPLLVKQHTLQAELEALTVKMEELDRGEYICKKCGIRKDGEGERGDF